MSKFPQAGEAKPPAWSPPTDPLELELVLIWQELLKVPRVGVTDDFYALGGDVPTAATMIELVEQELDVRLPRPMVTRPLTVETLAEKLHAVRPVREPAVTLNAGGVRRPLFLFHGDYNGGGFYAHRLARQLGREQPLHVVHPHGMNGTSIPATIEAMAASRLPLVRRLQPGGPYLLAGYCVAGLVALEVARMLAAEGERVELLALVAAVPRRWRHISRAGVRQTTTLLLRAPAPGIAVCARAAAAAARAFGEAWHDGASVRGDGAATTPDPPRAAARIERYLRYLRALERYCPRPYPSPAVVFWGVEDRSTSLDPVATWEVGAPRMKVEFLPGGHFEVLTRYLPELGERLDDRLRIAHAARSVTAPA